MERDNNDEKGVIDDEFMDPEQKKVCTKIYLNIHKIIEINKI
jgi:hypothetical protein